MCFSGRRHSTGAVKTRHSLLRRILFFCGRVSEKDRVCPFRINLQGLYRPGDDASTARGSGAGTVDRYLGTLATGGTAQRWTGQLCWSGVLQHGPQTLYPDPLRPGDETTHHPGEALLRMADNIDVAKVNSASDADIQLVTENVKKINSIAPIVRGVL